MLFDSLSQDVSLFLLYFLVLKLWNNRGFSGGKIKSKYLDKMPQRQKSGLKVSRLKRRRRRKKLEARLGQTLNKSRERVILSQYLNML